MKTMIHKVGYDILFAPALLGSILIVLAGKIQAIICAEWPRMSPLSRAILGGEEFVRSATYRWLWRSVGAALWLVAVALWLFIRART